MINNTIGSGNEVNSSLSGYNTSSIMSSINNMIPHIKKYLPYIAIGVIAIIFLKRRS